MNPRTCLAALLTASVIFPGAAVRAEPIAVRVPEGSVRGFLALRDKEGRILASGNLTEVVKGNHILSHMVFRFRDGSVDDETTIFTQEGCFRLVSDHHIQKGRTFPEPMDMQIEAASGKVTVRYNDKGVEKVDTEQMKLPGDVANGVIFVMMKNIAPDVKELKVPFVAATPKPRLVKLSVSADGAERFRVGHLLENSNRFNIKIEIGGVAGVIAPLVGKQPADMKVWIASGEVPEFVKLEGPLYLGGPIWTIELTSPVWPRAAR